MPPKKQSRKAVPATAPTRENGQEVQNEGKGEQEEQDERSNGQAAVQDLPPDSKTSTKTSTKRKQQPAPAPPSKSARRSRSTPKHTPTPTQLLTHLLSPACAPLCRPKDESEALDSDPSLCTYTSTVPLTPFQELVSALVLSRPISHALGQRSIRTLLNAPYDFNNPEAVTKAGVTKMHEALEHARTQHKAKTAEQVFGLAEACEERFGGGGLEGLRTEVDGDVGRLREVVTKGVKGLGKTGVDIFLRRVQGVWGEFWPVVDERTKGSVEKLGLPVDAEELRDLIAEEWGKLDVAGLRGEDEEEKRRRAFVLVLERAVGADLESNVEEVLASAASS